MDISKRYRWLKAFYLFMGGFIGVLSAAPMVPKLIEFSGQTPPLPMPVIQAASIMQTSILLAIMISLGNWLAPKVNLKTPLLDALLTKAQLSSDIKTLLVTAAMGGLLGGALMTFIANSALPFTPVDFQTIARVLNPPFYTKILYGGITEEVLIRWGLMTAIVWASFRFTQKPGSPVKTYNYINGILISALIFGVGHLPAATLLSSTLTLELALYIILGNGLFGLIAGFLFWKHGLEAAVIAHMLAHCVMTLCS